jgi:hypothetical protein
MSVGWSGGDPSDFSDGGSATYELGTEYLANGDVTINNVRVWGHAASAARANRAGKVWSSGGAQLASAVLPDTLLAGWHTYPLDVPVEVPAGTTVIVSYDVTDTYGATTTSLGYPRLSADTNVSAVRARRDLSTPDVFPSGNTLAAFYGIDIDYEAGLVGNARPTVGITATAGTLSASATLTIDDESPSTVTYSIEWGDGSSTTGLTSLGPHNHTYAAAGLYAIMVTATDDGGLTDSAAVAVQVRDTIPAGLNFNGIVAEVANVSRRLGLYTVVTKHEPKNAPPAGVVSAIWVQRIGPARSGLSSTSVRLVLMQRVYTSMISDPADAIDPRIIRAVDRTMAALTADLDLGGLVSHIDLLGLEGGVPMSAEAGYLDQDGKLMRIMDITIPLILNDVWTQG